MSIKGLNVRGHDHITNDSLGTSYRLCNLDRPVSIQILVIFYSSIEKADTDSP